MRTEGERCPDNLLARSRRGQLSQVEQRALQAHAAICGLCRAALALGAWHDEFPDSPEPGDQALVARLASQVAARHPGASARGGGRRVWAAAAALALLASAGGAAAWIRLRESRPSPARPVTGPARLAPEARAALTRTPPAIAAAPPLAPAAMIDSPAGPPAGATAPADRAPAATSAAKKPAAPAGDPSAADLFAAANAARGVRDLRRAVARYRLLQARFPASAEAQVSHFSAGDLLAQLAEPAAALAQFDDYLSARPAGPLAPEALYGRARALRALDRRAAEAAAWSELLHRYPGSIYDAPARRRLDELAR